MRIQSQVIWCQHFNSIETFLKGSDVNRFLLTGGMIGKKREQVLFEIENGDIDIVVTFPGADSMNGRGSMGSRREGCAR